MALPCWLLCTTPPAVPQLARGVTIFNQKQLPPSNLAYMADKNCHRSAPGRSEEACQVKRVVDGPPRFHIIVVCPLNYIILITSHVPNRPSSHPQSGRFPPRPSKTTRTHAAYQSSVCCVNRKPQLCRIAAIIGFAAMSDFSSVQPQGRRSTSLFLRLPWRTGRMIYVLDWILFHVPNSESPSTPWPFLFRGLVFLALKLAGLCEAL